MKKLTVLLIIAMLISGLLAGCSGSQSTGVVNTTGNKPVFEGGKLIDGTYEAALDYDREGYAAKCKLEIKDGKIANIDWHIYDKTGRIFDENYEEVYTGNNVYVEQCRNDWKGAQTYGPKLLEVQDINHVDAISRATWSNEKFKAVVIKALEQAKEKK